jgi:hypothetical protein
MSPYRNRPVQTVDLFVLLIAAVAAVMFVSTHFASALAK